MYKPVVLAVLFVGGWLFAQANEGQSEHPPQDKNGQIIVKGCVSRSSGHFILMQSDPGHSYVLEAPGTIDVGHYLGQQVQVTGTESHTSPTSSHSIRETGGGPPLTITADSIKTISKRCTH
jgi:hypothetical protein